MVGERDSSAAHGTFASGLPGGLVGRSLELAAIRRVLGQLGDANGSGPRFLEVRGDPGFGKTCLLSELLADAEQRGFLVLRGRATEVARYTPLQAFVEALDEYLVSVLEELPPSVRAVLGGMFPALSEPADRCWRPGDDRYRLYRGIHLLLEWLAASRHVVVVLDDVHWVDAALIELVDYLTRHPPRAPVLTVLAYRPRQVSARLVHALATAPAGLVERVVLQPLTLADISALAGPAVPEAHVLELHARSIGNPFYLNFYLNAPVCLHETGDWWLTAPEWPADELPVALQSALLSEMEYVSRVTRLVASAAAVTGDPFDLDVVAEVAGVRAARAARAAEELVERDLVRPAGSGPRLRYRHPLVRRVVYITAGVIWLREAHARTALALARRGSSVLLRAGHVARSARVGDLCAIELLSASAHATRTLAPALAAGSLRSALRLLLKGETHTPLRHKLEGELALALCLTGELAAAQAVADQLLGELRSEQCSPGSEVGRNGAVMVRTRVDRLLGRHAETRAGLLGELALAVPDSTEAATLQLELAVADLFAGRFAMGWRAPQEALRTARQVNDRPLEAAAAAMLVLGSYAAGAIPQALAGLPRAALLVDGLTETELADRLDAAVWLGWGEMFLERYLDSLRHFDRALVVLRRTGQCYLLTYLHVGTACALQFLGRLAEATQHAGDAVHAAELSASDELRTMAYAMQCLVAIRVGARDLALRAGEAADTAAGQVQDWWSVLARLGLAQARLAAGAEPAQCRADLLAAGGGAELPAVDAGTRPLFYQPLVHAELTRGCPDAAGGWVDRLEAAAAALGPGLRNPGALALLTRAEVLLAVGETAAAQERALQALAGFEQVGACLEAGRAHLITGLALSATGARGQAREQLNRARTVFSECGAGQLRDQAVRGLRRLGVRINAGASADPTGDGVAGPGATGLTRRELQVAALVAEGCTNRQIAERLVLSERTIDAHLRHIFTKLDVSSRAALTATLVRQHGR